MFSAKPTVWQSRPRQSERFEPQAAEQATPTRRLLSFSSSYFGKINEGFLSCHPPRRSSFYQKGTTAARCHVRLRHAGRGVSTAPRDMSCCLPSSHAYRTTMPSRECLPTISIISIGVCRLQTRVVGDATQREVLVVACVPPDTSCTQLAPAQTSRFTTAIFIYK